MTDQQTPDPLHNHPAGEYPVSRCLGCERYVQADESHRWSAPAPLGRQSFRVPYAMRLKRVAVGLQTIELDEPVEVAAGEVVTVEVVGGRARIDVSDWTPGSPYDVPVSASSETRRDEATRHLLSFFAVDHLPIELQAYARPCRSLALEMVETLPDGPELTAGLRKLLEAKDCFVRARVSEGSDN